MFFSKEREERLALSPKKISSDLYLHMLKEHMFSFYNLTTYLEQMHKNALGWPGNNLDLNLVENCWYPVKKLFEMKTHSLEALFLEDIRVTIIDKLIGRGGVGYVRVSGKTS